jgi:hypothetical protein
LPAPHGEQITIQRNRAEETMRTVIAIVVFAGSFGLAQASPMMIVGNDVLQSAQRATLQWRQF